MRTIPFALNRAMHKKSNERTYSSAIQTSVMTATVPPSAIAQSVGSLVFQS
ncbi:hypothetical protein V1291_005324 [Nitrobacteraceae bacterium AZCC 1564]